MPERQPTQEPTQEPTRVLVPAYVLDPPHKPAPVTPNTPAKKENFPHLPQRYPTIREAQEILSALVKHRKAANYPQREIARRLERTPGRICELESILRAPEPIHRARRPRFVTLERYALALGGKLVETPGGWRYRPPTDED